MKTPLTAGNSDRVMAKTISIQAQEIEKVQRPERELVATSVAKWGVTRTVSDMVYSCEKLQAVGNNGTSLTNLCEYIKYAFFVLDPRKNVRHATVTLH